MRSTATAWQLVIACLWELLCLTPGNAAQYVIDGIRLGDRVPIGSSNYRSYACRPSDDFAGLTWCHRSQQRGGYVASNTILHAPDGTAAYLMVNVAPVSLNRDVLVHEIDELSREIGEQPVVVEWLPKYQQRPLTTSVIAV